MVGDDFFFSSRQLQLIAKHGLCKSRTKKIARIGRNIVWQSECINLNLSFSLDSAQKKLCVESKKDSKENVLQSAHEWLINLFESKIYFWRKFEETKIPEELADLLIWRIKAGECANKFPTGSGNGLRWCQRDSLCALTFLQRFYPSPSIFSFLSWNSHFLYRCIFHAVWIVGFKD